LFRWVRIVLSLGVLAAPEFPSMAMEGNILPETPIAFDIPSQPLHVALETYGITTGREVVYNGKLAVGRQSAAVRGVFAPEIALQILLEGTGLSPRYTAADAFVLVPSSGALGLNPLVNTTPPVAVAHYYGRIQSSLRLAFCSNSRTQPGNYRIAVSFWIGSSGSVSRVELLGSTGNSDLDMAIEHVMRGLAIGAPPPPGFAQPVTLVVAPQSAGMTQDCQAVRAEHPARAAR
jgi:TonB family protein